MNSKEIERIEPWVKRFLFVKKETAKTLDEACDKPLLACGRDEVIFDEEVTFFNGIRMAIQAISTNAPEIEPIWTQGVLFDQHGNELGCTEVGDQFSGEYGITHEGELYIVEVAGRFWA